MGESSFGKCCHQSGHEEEVNGSSRIFCLTCHQWGNDSQVNSAQYSSSCRVLRDYVYPELPLSRERNVQRETRESGEATVVGSNVERTVYGNLKVYDNAARQGVLDLRLKGA